MAHNISTSYALYEGNPYIRIAPYTGYYQFRRKYEGQTDTAAYSSVSSSSSYYSWSIIRNRLRGVYPTGGRLGMCMVLEKTRTARYYPYGSYAWPNASMSLPAWPLPTMVSSGRVDYQGASETDIGGSSLNASLVFAWTVGMSDVQTINDTHPPAGLCTDLSGVVAYIRASDIAIQTVDLTKAVDTDGLDSAFGDTVPPLATARNRYELAPMVLHPPVSPAVTASAIESLAEITPSGIFWPSPDNAPVSSDTFDKSRILPFTESWREINLFPIAYDDSGYTLTYIGNWPIDYHEAYSSDRDGHSTMYRSSPTSDDDAVYEFPGFVYWVTREGPLDLIKEEDDPDKEEKVRSVNRRVLVFVFEAALTGIEDNERSRYRAKPDLLVGSNSISPRDIKSSPEGLLEPYKLTLGGLYNQVYSDLGMDSPGAPSESGSAWSVHSEILHHYDVSHSAMSGNIILDDHMFKRCLTSGQVHSTMWSELGRVFRYSVPFAMPSGGSLTLMGAMATVGIMGSLAASSYHNERFAIYLGGISQSVVHNNPMPEVGVTLGSHLGDHTIYLLECGLEIEFGGEEEDGAPENINKLLSHIPNPIYTYRGFASSPHRVTLLDDGVVLIPTDIGILQYDYVNEEVDGEWLNPVLIPYIADLLVSNTGADISYSVGEPSWIEVDTPDGPMVIPQPSIQQSVSVGDEAYTPSASNSPSVSAEQVYERTAHMGSYGQVVYESSDFSADLIVRLVR